jgi:hypothetical protein
MKALEYLILRVLHLIKDQARCHLNMIPMDHYVTKPQTTIELETQLEGKRLTLDTWRVHHRAQIKRRLLKKEGRCQHSLHQRRISLQPTSSK